MGNFRMAGSGEGLDPSILKEGKLINFKRYQEPEGELFLKHYNSL